MRKAPRLASPGTSNAPPAPRAATRRAAEQRDKLTASIKKTRSHGTIAKRVGWAKRPRSAKGLPFSSSRVGRQRPVRNSLDHLVGEREQLVRNVEAERFGGLEVDHQLEFNRLHHGKVLRLRSIQNPRRIDA